ncbi:hypothetical protein [Jatrophihabitans fulvus]
MGGSAAFRARQQTVFANLAQLRFTTFEWSRGPTVDEVTQREVRRTRGGDALVVRLTLAYALQRADDRPAEQTVYWTLARQGGRVVVVSDSDLAREGGASWRGPWDFGPVDVVRGTSSLVIVHPQDAELGPVVADTLDRAVSGVSDVVGTGWRRYVAALVPATTAERDALIGSPASATAGLAAAAVSEADDDTTTSLLVAPRMVIDPSQYRRLSPAGSLVLVRHEVTHIAVGGRETDSVPRWLAEGFADYVGYARTDEPVPTIARELAARLRAGFVPRSLPDAAAFDAASTGASAYQLAWLACRWVAQRFGQDRLVRLYRAVLDDTGDPATAVPRALRSVLGVSSDQFVTGWRDYVRTEFRG